MKMIRSLFLVATLMLAFSLQGAEEFPLKGMLFYPTFKCDVTLDDYPPGIIIKDFTLDFSLGSIWDKDEKKFLLYLVRFYTTVEDKKIEFIENVYINDTAGAKELRTSEIGYLEVFLGYKFTISRKTQASGKIVTYHLDYDDNEIKITGQLKNCLSHQNKMNQLQNLF